MLDNVGDKFLGDVEEAEETNESATTAKRTRVKSETPFPYVALDGAVNVAEVIRKCGAVPLSKDQLMSQFDRNGNFAAKLAAAVMFGLIERQDRKYHLTDLGKRITTEKLTGAKSANIEAFLRVSLYKKIVEHFQGVKLPDAEAFEAVLVKFGVTPKLKDRARWAFEKSASFAGFYNSAKDRLVMPIFSEDKAPEDLTITDETNGVNGVKENEAEKKQTDPSHELLIRGMLDRLPKIGTTWKAADRVRWLRRLSSNLTELYDPTDDTNVKIEIEKVGEPSP